ICYPSTSTALTENNTLSLHDALPICKALGHAVHILDERWAPIIAEKGELSCTEPFPSAPLTFWGENGDERYYEEYFAECDDIWRSEEHTSELQSRFDLVCRLLLAKKK